MDIEDTEEYLEQLAEQGYDRVTQILYPFSGLSKVPDQVLKNANQRGTSVHLLCEGIINNFDVDVPEIYKGYIDSFLQWKEGKTFLKNPGRFFDQERLITGKMDGLFIDNHVKMPKIFDLKTSVKESISWKYQGAAYWNIAESYFGCVYSQEQHFIKLSKTGGAPKVFVYYALENLEMFYKCLHIYREFFKNKNAINGDDL